MIDKDNTDNLGTDEIDLNVFFKVFKRNWAKISIATGLITISSIFYSFTIKPTYQGSFEIVVEDKERNKGNINALSNLISLGNVDEINTLKTQESILKSPSVLLPIFEYVKKDDKKLISRKKLDYKKWLKYSLNIEFNKGTNILLIEYKNKNKDKIITVLNMISKRYQQYSKNDREKIINNSIEYLSAQQKIFKKKSKDSLKSLNAFSIENGLGDVDGFVELDNSFSGNIGIDMESKEDVILKELIKNNPSQKSSTNAGFRYKNQFRLLESYEAQYTNLSSILKPNSKTLKNLEIKINNLKSALKRPNEILLKYRDLKKIAQRDENTLSNIEVALVKSQLEKVRQQEPWQMISTPTVEKEKISPNKKLIASISLLISFFVFYLIFLIKEKLSGLIFEKKDFAEKVECDYLETIFLRNESINKKLMKNLLKSFGYDNYGYVFPKSINNRDFSQRENYNLLNLGIIESKIPNISNESEVKKFDKLVIIFEEGKYSFNDIELINNYIKIYKNKFIGWFFITN